MDYFHCQREDGKYDIREGTEDSPGRIVTTLDTNEEAISYIDNLDKVMDALIPAGMLDDEIEAEEVVAAEEEPMPWKLVAKDGQTCVVKESDGSVEKCHDSREDAVAHMKALYVNAADGSVQAAIDKFDTENVIVSNNVTSNGGGIVVAHAEPAAPPPSFFTDPGFSKLERYVTVTADGRIYTHVAGWSDCHIGYGDMCVSAPRESDYSNFTVGSVLTSDGSTIPTGVLALKGGHADMGLDAASARSHYDDPSSAIADIVVGTDDFGIWMSGALRSSATPEDIRALRASGVSGDWRLIDGELRLIGICCVNVPGFSKLAMSASADGTLEVLVAAGGSPLPDPDLDCNCDDRYESLTEEITKVHDLLVASGIEDNAIERLSSRIADEPSDDELDDLYSRVS